MFLDQKIKLIKEATLRAIKDSKKSLPRLNIINDALSILATAGRHSSRAVLIQISPEEQTALIEELISENPHNIVKTADRMYYWVQNPACTTENTHGSITQQKIAEIRKDVMAFMSSSESIWSLSDIRHQLRRRESKSLPLAEEVAAAMENCQDWSNGEIVQAGLGYARHNDQLRADAQTKVSAAIDAYAGATKLITNLEKTQIELRDELTKTNKGLSEAKKRAKTMRENLDVEMKAFLIQMHLGS